MGGPPYTESGTSSVSRLTGSITACGGQRARVVRLVNLRPSSNKSESHPPPTFSNKLGSWLFLWVSNGRSRCRRAVPRHATFARVAAPPVLQNRLAADLVDVVPVEVGLVDLEARDVADSARLHSLTNRDTLLGDMPFEGGSQGWKCMWPLTRRSCLPASTRPAAHRRRGMFPFRQFFTLAEWCGGHPPQYRDQPAPTSPLDQHRRRPTTSRQIRANGRPTPAGLQKCDFAGTLTGRRATAGDVG